MNFADPPRRSSTESVVPMINVVFLLLIFFLMTSSLTPPEPIEVAPPVASGEQAERREAVLYIGAEGTLAFGEARGEAALAAFVAQAGEAAQLRADGRVEAATVARVLRQLAASGLPRVELVAVPQ
ncbi:biopolymer transporter ExbD [Oceanicola sp. D3]|uniref:ExbD/TolR family protein n=1 Tax=Oceanicola sp. D3 TaxID=2587163 RepID=UPI001121E02A|nr:biopolymer transporter ExbD [Oceanicola sp. D3]QDC08575.1 biopolymer transporter ExbD [Oceanicola sp. D3]